MIRTEAQISAPESFNPKEATHLPPLHLRRPEFRMCLTSRIKSRSCDIRGILPIFSHFGASPPSFRPLVLPAWIYSRVRAYFSLINICTDSTSQRSTRQGEMDRIPRVRRREGTRRQSLEWYDTKESPGKLRAFHLPLFFQIPVPISSLSKQFPFYSRLLVSLPAYHHVERYRNCDRLQPWHVRSPLASLHRIASPDGRSPNPYTHFLTDAPPLPVAKRSPVASPPKATPYASTTFPPIRKASTPSRPN